VRIGAPLSKQSEFDAIESECVGGHVLLTRMRGHATRALAEQQFHQFNREIAVVSNPIWIIEQLEMTGFDPGAVTMGARWFSSFKERGGQRVIIVSTLAMARMATVSMAFAVNAKSSCCETLKEAYELAGIGQVEVRPSKFSLRPAKPGEAPPSRR
jgi:hypothetical protein